jgi:NAD(P)-dependent dehydrogenase (short-subunit alcohol dehydrogenase family)
MPRFAPLPERRPAIVAGASSGIGEATAIELAAHGFPVALGARRVEKLDDIVGKINAEGGEAVGFHLDVTDPNSVKSFVAQSVNALGDIEVLVAGAGDTYFGKLAEITTDEFESQMQVHLIGANRLASAVLPGMLDRQRGDLIFVGSDVALRQRPHMGAYGAAKASLLAMVDGLEPAGREDRPRAGGLGQMGPGPPRLLPARRGPGTGHHIRRRNTARRLHREHGATARGPVGGYQGPPETRTRRRRDART